MTHGVVVNTVRGVQECFLDSSFFLILNPIVLGLGLLIRRLLSQDTFDSWKNSYWISDQNIVNRTFADHGLNVFIGGCLLIFAGRVLIKELQDRQVPLLPTNYSLKTRTIQKVQKTLKIAIPYLVRYLITYTLLVLFFKLKNYESIVTGGQCEPKTQAVSARQVSSTVFMKRSLSISCAPDEEWVPGSLNISGHYAFLGTLSLSLLYELKLFLHSSIDSIEKSFEEQDDDDESSWNLKTSITLLGTISFLSLFVVLIWCGVLTITAIFYHTLQEKIMGLAFAYISPMLNYVLLLRFYDA